MFLFHAYFWNTDVYINQRYKYRANEILTAFLNTKFKGKEYYEDLMRDLKKYRNRLIIEKDMDYSYVENYNSNVQKANTKIFKVNALVSQLPPYDKISSAPDITLEDILNNVSFMFEYGPDEDEDKYNNPDLDTFTEYGSGDMGKNGNIYFRLHRFDIAHFDSFDWLDEDMAEDLRNFNETVKLYFDGYISFLNSFLIVHTVFKPFINNYLHRKETFASFSEATAFFKEFNNTSAINFENLKCKMNSFGYKIIPDENGNPMLCENIEFKDICSFIYYDFINGLKKNFIPNKCKHCGRYFLLCGGKYFNYCDRPLEDEPDKTCRDVGARRRYGDKCKNDPIWQTYNRAYKAHYARYMKKKMTISEFEEWSRFASDIRDRAIAEDIAYSDYYEQIRK